MSRKDPFKEELDFTFFVKGFLWSLLVLLFCVILVAVAKGAEVADVDQIELPYPAVLECWKIDNAKKVRAYPGLIEGRGYMAMEVDTNNDGRKDTLLLFPAYPIEGGAMVALNPRYIVFDGNYDGHPDEAYEDGSAVGDCAQLKKVPLNLILKDYKGA